MRTTAERLAEAKRRARELERERQRRRARGIFCAGTAACFVMIVSLALVMPGITDYLVVGLLAFALGVCVTVLCVRLRGHEGDSADEERYDD